MRSTLFVYVKVHNTYTNNEVAGGLSLTQKIIIFGMRLEWGRLVFKMSKSSLESGESCKTGNKARADSGRVELNGGYRLRRSSRKRQNICYNENLYHEGDSVCPPKSLRDIHMSSATKKEQQNAAVTDGVFKMDRSTDSAAADAVDRYNKEPKQKASASREERFRSKKMQNW